jgi:hypothetical protein
MPAAIAAMRLTATGNHLHPFSPWPHHEFRDAASRERNYSGLAEYGYSVREAFISLRKSTCKAPQIFMQKNWFEFLTFAALAGLDPERCRAETFMTSRCFGTR